MKKQFCAKCGALLGQAEYGFCEGIEGVVCDACSEDTLSATQYDRADCIHQPYEIGSSISVAKK